MPQNLQIARPLASVNLDDAALNDVIYIAVTDGVFLTFSVINRAEDGLDFLRLKPQPLTDKFRAPLGAKHETTFPYRSVFLFLIIPFSAPSCVNVRLSLLIATSFDRRARKS